MQLNGKVRFSVYLAIKCPFFLGRELLATRTARRGTVSTGGYVACIPLRFHHGGFATSRGGNLGRNQQL